MESMRAAYQLNQEKLDYNYRVLLERDAENLATITQQKRKVSKQRDLLSSLMVPSSIICTATVLRHVRKPAACKLHLTSTDPQLIINLLLLLPAGACWSSRFVEHWCVHTENVQPSLSQTTANVYP